MDKTEIVKNLILKTEILSQNLIALLKEIQFFVENNVVE
jgi:hypothetical protein